MTKLAVLGNDFIDFDVVYDHLDAVLAALPADDRLTLLTDKSTDIGVYVSAWSKQHKITCYDVEGSETYSGTRHIGQQQQHAFRSQGATVHDLDGSRSVTTGHGNWEDVTNAEQQFADQENVGGVRRLLPRYIDRNDELASRCDRALIFYDAGGKNATPVSNLISRLSLENKPADIRPSRKMQVAALHRMQATAKSLSCDSARKTR